MSDYNITVKQVQKNVIVRIASQNHLSGANLGAGAGVYAGLTGSVLNFKSLVAGSGIGITTDANSITFTSQGGGHTIQEEGVSVTNRTKLNFISQNLAVTDDAINDRTNVTLTANPSFESIDVDGGALLAGSGLNYYSMNYLSDRIEFTPIATPSLNTSPISTFYYDDDSGSYTFKYYDRNTSTWRRMSHQLAIGQKVFGSDIGTDPEANAILFISATGNLSIDYIGDAGLGYNSASKTLTAGNVELFDNGIVKFKELDTNGGDYIGLKAPASLAANVIYTLPDSGSEGQFLKLGASNVMSWATAVEDGGTIASLTLNTALNLRDISGSYALQVPIRFFEDSSNGSNYVELKAPASIGSNKSFILPAADSTPVINYYTPLCSDGAGNLSFQNNLLVNNLKAAGSIIGITSDAFIYDFVNSRGLLGIGVTSINSKACLDIESTTRGVLFPRMTTTQRDAITTPPIGLMIDNTTLNRFERWDGSSWQLISPAAKTVGFSFNGNSTPSTGIVGYTVIAYSGKIVGWDIVGAPAGSIVVDVWKANGSMPTVSDSIAGSEKPNLSGQELNSDTNLTTWTSLIVEPGDVIAFNIDSISVLTKLTLTLRIIQTS